MILSRPFILFFILLGLSSCVSQKDLINFRNGDEKIPAASMLPKQEISNQTDLKLQANDILALVITSPDANLSAPYNLIPTQLGSQITTPSSVTSFLIGSDGMLNVPSLGAIKASGLTVKELRDEVLKRVSVFLESPSVNIRLINFKISVFGEVRNPNTFQITNERVTILEALSQAGDLTPYSNRSHIIVIREHDGIREQGEINLKNNNFFTSPYYYLQQNDVVYVEPTKLKAAEVKQPIINTYLTPVQVGLSLLTTILLIFKK
jgi:polysaccharide biosynthesis/export protein